MLQWCRDHTGTHSHTGKPEYHPGTQTGIVMDFTLFYVFLLMINTTFLCIYQKQCCYVSLFSVSCIMMEWFIQIQLNVLCYRVFNLTHARAEFGTPDLTI